MPFHPNTEQVMTELEDTEEGDLFAGPGEEMPWK